jgi:hypothetical protein
MRDPEETRYKKRIVKKPFGIESWREYSKTWGNRSWYATEKARDQAISDLRKKTTIIKPPPVFRKVDRWLSGHHGSIFSHD